jgi:hypothetical protein
MYNDYACAIDIDSYIADPYWPEREELVNIEKRCGVNRIKNDDRREAALRNWLTQNKLTMEHYQELQRRAARQWYTDDQGQIVIPRHHFSGCLVQACSSAPAGARFKGEELRSLVQLEDFATDRCQADETFRRFCRPTAGGSNKVLSNQRTLRSNEVIRHCTAAGTIRLDADAVKPASFRALLEYAGKHVGIGASRKMGFGRFTVREFKAIE